MIKTLGLLLPILFLSSLPIEVVSGETRGIRNNNPSNLVATSIKWKGKVKCSDVRFECFSTPYYGVRAMYKTLNTYYYKHNKRSIREIMNRWSPSHENKTERIIRDISRALAWKPDDPIPINSITFLYDLGSILIKMENGRDPYTFNLHRRAIKDAFRNNNNVRKYHSSRDVEDVVDVISGKGQTTTSSDRKREVKKKGSTGCTEGEGRRVCIHKKSDSHSSNILNRSLSDNNSTILRVERNSWLDRVAERIPILHRWKGCNDMERGNWPCNNPSPHSPRRSDQWAVLWRKHRRSQIEPIYIQ